MQIQNPFESGHIRNYILAYVGVVAIMVLFFIAAHLFGSQKNHPKKEFAQKPSKGQQQKVVAATKEKEIEQNTVIHKTSSIKLLQKAF